MSLGIAKQIHFETEILNLNAVVDDLSDITREHGDQIREIYKLISSLASKAELSVAISTVRAQYLNGHIPTTKFRSGFNEGDEESFLHLRQRLEAVEKENREERKAAQMRISALEKSISELKIAALETTLKFQGLDISRGQTRESQTSKRLDTAECRDKAGSIDSALLELSPFLSSERDEDSSTNSVNAASTLDNDNDDFDDENCTEVIFKAPSCNEFMIKDEVAIGDTTGGCIKDEISFSEEESVPLYESVIVTGSSSQQQTSDISDIVDIVDVTKTTSASIHITESTEEVDKVKKTFKKTEKSQSAIEVVAPGIEFSVGTKKKNREKNKDDLVNLVNNAVFTAVKTANSSFNHKISSLESALNASTKRGDIGALKLDSIFASVQNLDRDHSGLMATLKDLSDRLSGTESAIFELINNLAGVVDSSQTDIEENEERLFAMAKIVKRLLAEFRLSTSLVPDTAGSSGQANDQAAMVDVLASVYDEDANSDPVSTRRARREKDREVLHGALNLPNGGIFKEMKALHRAYCRMVLEYKRLGQKHFSTQIRRNVGNDDHETHKNREPDVRDSIEKAEELFARFTENTPASSSSPLKIAEESPVCTSSPFKFVEDNLLYSSFPFKITEDGSVHSSAPFKNAEGKFTTSSSTDNQHRDKQGDKFITRVETMKLFNGLSLRHQAELQRLRADLAALKSTSGMLKPPESVYAGTVFDSKSIALPATEMKGRAFRSNCSSSQESAGTGKRTPATHREGVVDSGPSELSVSSQRSSYSSWKDPSGSFASFQDEQDAFMEKKLLDINVEVFKSPKKGSLAATPPIILKASKDARRRRHSSAVMETPAPTFTQEYSPSAQRSTILKQLAECPNILGAACYDHHSNSTDSAPSSLK